MAAHPWDESIRTGVESVDAEHRLQVSLVGALEELLRRGGEPALVERTVGQLVDFTRVHFTSEELMMRLYAYPQYPEHRAEHERLTGEVPDLQRRITGPDAAVALAAVETLQRWLTGHIRTMDLAFAAWCASNAIHAR